MARKNEKRKEIENYILEYISENPKNVSSAISAMFGVSRQTANIHLRRMVKDNLLQQKGTTKAREYTLVPMSRKSLRFDISPTTEENAIWRNEISEQLKSLPENVYEICHHGFTEMFNNIIDHSGSRHARVHVERNPVKVKMYVQDAGVGIFQKILDKFGFDDVRQVLLELSKGKLTTDPEKHTGEGIFFTSRMFDFFMIASGNSTFQRHKGEDWFFEERTRSFDGTIVSMEISILSKRKVEEIFNQYASEFNDYGFSKTHVPVKLAQYEGERLISRSQAKRLLARVDKFHEVLLDFTGVQSIGQAFADEIFRVYKNEHPNVLIVYIRANDDVKKMIERAIRRSEED